MIVACESCGTKFRLDPKRFKSAKSKVRCSRCGHMFMVSVGKVDEPVLPDISREVSLSDDREEAFSPPPFPAPSPLPPSRKRSWRVPLIVAGIAAVLIAAGAFWILNPQRPFTSNGGSGEKDAGVSAPAVSSLKVLNTTQAYFLENAHAGQIFVVEGEAVNESPKSASFVLIEGKIHGIDDAPILTQRCFLGNVLSREELSRLNINDIQNRMMNREGKNLINVKIKTGQKTPFMLVFHNLPELKTLSDYRIEVISAQFN
jgi:predicted Zn finger-like uncharacterized protein